MTDWICPNCRGGFPSFGKEQWSKLPADHCPWCGQELGEFDPPSVHSISKVESDDDYNGIFPEWLR